MNDLSCKPLEPPYTVSLIIICGINWYLKGHLNGVENNCVLVMHVNIGNAVYKSAKC